MICSQLSRKWRVIRRRALFVEQNLTINVLKSASFWLLLKSRLFPLLWHKLSLSMDIIGSFMT